MRETEGGTLRQTLMLIVLSAVVSASWRAICRTHRHRHTSRCKAPLPERLQTWEGEGGRPDPELEPGVYTPS